MKSRASVLQRGRDSVGFEELVSSSHPKYVARLSLFGGILACCSMSQGDLESLVNSFRLSVCLWAIGGGEGKLDVDSNVFIRVSIDTHWYYKA